MALFESGSRKVLKRIRKLAGEGSVNKISATVKEERNSLLEESDVALELVTLLLDIGHPNLAADVGEEVMHRHRQIAGDIRNLFIKRLDEFSRSTALLRATWSSFFERHDFKNALYVLDKVDEVAENKFFDFIEDIVKNSTRFDGSIHPDADQSSLVEWALCLFKKRKPDNAIDFLWKVCKEVEFPHRDIPLLAYWIGNQSKSLHATQWISLMGISAVSGKMEEAMQYAHRIVESEPSPDEAVDAADVIEKWMIPVDRSGGSSAILAEMYTAAGKTEAASKTLESIYDDSLDREKLESAIEDLVSHPDSGAAPLLLSAQMNLERGRIDEAVEAVERAFQVGDAESSKLIEVCRQLLETTGDTVGTLAVELASYLVNNGDVDDAVVSLFPIVNINAPWVFEQVQKLISRDRNNASILALLAAVLFETGKKGKATATLAHLSRRMDKKFCREAATVLDSLEDQVLRYPELMEARALFRLRSERRDEAAADWFNLLLKGIDTSAEGRELLISEGLSIGSVAELEESGFVPGTSWQAFVAAMISLREGRPEKAQDFIIQALEDSELRMAVATRINGLSEKTLKQLDLRSILSMIKSGEAASVASSILEKLGGSEDWKLALVTELNWGNQSEEARFRLRYLLAQGKIVLAGSSYVESSIAEPVVLDVARACVEMISDRSREALEHLGKPVTDRLSSNMARHVLEYLLKKAPGLSTDVRKLMATSFETENSYDDLATILLPVLAEENVLKLLEEMIERHPGELAITDSLTQSSALRGDFDRFQKYSAVMLDIDSASAPGIVEMAGTMAENQKIGEAFLYAARVAQRHNVDTDIDKLITQAVFSDSGLINDDVLTEFGGIGAAARAMCAVACGNSDVFSEVLRQDPTIEIPLDEHLIEAAASRWSPENDAEALSGITRSASSLGFASQVEGILSRLAAEASDPWDTVASEKLLREVVAGNAQRISFWKSVRVNSVIAEALERLFPDGFSDVGKEEAGFVASAVLQSSQGIRRLFKLADDDLFFPKDDPELRSKLAEACLNNLPEPQSEEALSSDETGKLLDILLSAGMIGEAVRIARETGTDSALSRIRENIVEVRSRLPLEGLDKVSALILSGDPAGALKEIGGLDDKNQGILDLKALAQWDIGQRNQAISTWITEYKSTGGEEPLKRLIWALGQTGAMVEKAALKRYIAQKHANLIGLFEVDDIRNRPERMELISGLRISSKVKKVKNG